MLQYMLILNIFLLQPNIYKAKWNKDQVNLYYAKKLYICREKCKTFYTFLMKDISTRKKSVGFLFKVAVEHICVRATKLNSVLSDAV